MFRQNGQIPIVRFESNFRTGQTFGWGHHHIVYLAEDAAGNWATCEVVFKLARKNQNSNNLLFNIYRISFIA